MVHIGHGTLNVVLGNRRCIVLTTDSRRSSRNSPVSDNTKKLFKLPSNRFLAIAGCVDAVLNGCPDITLQIPALLESAIARSGEYDTLFWEDPPIPNDMPEEIARFWGQDPYTWWNSIVGPFQTILNISATFVQPTELWRYGIVGIVAGYKANGEPKVEKLFHHPIAGTSSWGKLSIGCHRHKDRVPFIEPLMFTTSGITDLSNRVLSGQLESVPRNDLAGYSGIRNYFEHMDHDTVAMMSESDLCVLATDLIRATADRYPTVGHTPIQTAVIRASGEVHYAQPITSVPTLGLSEGGQWYMGVVSRSGFPCSSTGPGAVFTSCEIANNTSPISVGDNYFYGCNFLNARFIYTGGRVHFGDNNRLDNCELFMPLDVDATAVQGILAKFSRVVRQ